ncbi:MAG: tRNA lysidine(34) synthetase TilS [Bacteroidetes bacterium]|nr:tRNA lysidine(34) synthetase TilS [Bacteroidota bacterium]
MLEGFRRFAEKKELFSKGGKILAAVSGGLDSMVMVNLLKLAGYEFSVAHVNFMLRGNASDGDQLFVKQWCLENGIPFFSERLDAAKYSGEKGVSIQMSARELRYSWFKTLASEHNFSHIATAHHLDDHLETVLLQLSSGLGPAAVSGIPVKNELVVRPMMFTDRKSIHDFALARNITWREDESNQGDDYARNFLRHQVIEPWKRQHPNLLSSIELSTFKSLGVMEIFFEGLSTLKNRLIRLDQHGVGGIVMEELFEFKNPSSILFHLLSDFGFNRSQCEQMLEFFEHTGARFFSETKVAWIDRGRILIADPLPLSQEQVEIVGPGAYAKAGEVIRCTESNTPLNAPNVASLDLETLRFPLTWRNWEPGDVFVPSGMTGRKKLSDFLVDNKVPVMHKPNVSVVISGDDIVWVAGFRVSEKYRAKADTRKIFQIELQTTRR